MITYARNKLSGSTDGAAIQLGTGSTTIHTAVAGASDLDEVWVWFGNYARFRWNTLVARITIEWGGTSDPDDILEYSIPQGLGTVLVIPGWVLQNELVVSAKVAETTENLSTYVHGYVNEIRN